MRKDLVEERVGVTKNRFICSKGSRVVELFCKSRHRLGAVVGGS